MVAARLARYKDLNLSFEKHPLTGDIVLALDVEAVKKSLKHLILTNFYEVPFNPEKGTSINNLLFENFTPITTEFIKSKIKELIDLYEPRVDVEKITIYQNPDEHRIEITIQFNIIELNRFEEITVFVEATR